MLQHLLAFALLVVANLAATAQDRPAVEQKRGAYVVKYAAAKDLAGILAKHFKGAAEILAGPEGTSNCLLINAPPSVFDEIMKTLEQLDRRPHLVAIEIFVVEIQAKKNDDKDQGLDEKDFSGPIDDVANRLDAMMKKGQLAGFKRIQLNALEGQLSSLVLGENKPFVAGTNVTATGIVSKQIYYRNLGTQVKVRSQVAADRSITLDLNVEDNRSRDSATATVGSGEKGKPIPAAEFIQTILIDKVSVVSGKAILAKDTKVATKEGQGEMLIVVGARIVEPDAKPK